MHEAHLMLASAGNFLCIMVCISYTEDREDE